MSELLNLIEVSVPEQRHTDQAILTSTLEIHQTLGTITERLRSVLDEGENINKFLFGNGQPGFVKDINKEITQLKVRLDIMDARAETIKSLASKRITYISIGLAVLTIVMNYLMHTYFK